MKLIVAGSRQFEDDTHRKVIFDTLDELSTKIDITEVVCGMARGPDLLGKEWAESKNIPVALFPADWSRYKKSAGPIRNKQMGDYADVLLVFWDGKSRGTENMMDVMIKQQKPYYLIFL